jgi:hypothetical protein
MVESAVMTVYDMLETKVHFERRAANKGFNLASGTSERARTVMESLHLLHFAEQSMAGTEHGLCLSLLTFCWNLRRLIAIILKAIQDVGLDVAARSPALDANYHLEEKDCLGREA